MGWMGSVRGRGVECPSVRGKPTNERGTSPRLLHFILFILFLFIASLHSHSLLIGSHSNVFTICPRVHAQWKNK